MAEQAHILLVDDEEDFLDVMGEFLREQGYAVTSATSGREALELLSSRPIDLVLSDINMPGMKGFELLHRAAESHPGVKRALITAYDVRDYLNMARQFDVGNIITKTTPFNFEEARTLVRNLLTEEVFGVERYADGPAARVSIADSGQVEGVIEGVLAAIPDDISRQKFRHGLGELIINAIYYGARQEKGDRKDEWSTEVALPPQDAVEVAWSIDAEKAAVAVTDRKGRLTKQEVLYWFERNAVRRADGLPVGFYDAHGKGLYITRELNDRLIVNVKRGVCTEVVLINYRRGLYNGHRPLWIHEF